MLGPNGRFQFLKSRFCPDTDDNDDDNDDDDGDHHDDNDDDDDDVFFGFIRRAHFRTNRRQSLA